MKIDVGMKVNWESAVGHLEGIIEEIVIAKNARDELIPWLIVECGMIRKIRLAFMPEYVKMMKMNFSV